MSNASVPLAYRLMSRNFIRGYILTMRPYLLFVSGITGIAGAAFSTTVSPARIMLIACASFLAYGFGQALTDCFQIDTDSISSPYRPLTRGLLSRNLVLAVSGLGLAGCILLFTVLNPNTLLPGFLAGIGLLTYTFFKRRWWGGPLYNAWIVAALCTMAFNSGNHSSPLRLPDTLLLLAVLFGYANFVLAGYFKDISADRTTGYRTMPVVFGRSRSAIVSDCFAMLTILAAVALVVNHNQTGQTGQTGLVLRPDLFLIPGAVVTILAQGLLHRVATDEEAHVPIALVVHGYILLLSGVVVSRRPGWFPALVMFYVAFVLTLTVRPEKSQI